MDALNTINAEERTTKLKVRFLKNYSECTIWKTEDKKIWGDLKVGKIQ